MEVFDYLIGFVYYLIPGMLAWTIFCSLKSHREQDEFLKYAYPFLFSAACFTIGNVMVSFINRLLQLIKKVAEVLSGISSNEITGLIEILTNPDAKIGNSTFCFTIGNVIASFVNRLLQLIKKVAEVLSGISLIEITGLNEILTNPDAKIANATLYVALVISICLGYMAFYVDEHHVLFKIANALKITNREDNDSVWDNVFGERREKGKRKDNTTGERWIYYRDHISEKTYYGCVIKWSDKQEIKEVKMQNVSVRKEGKEQYKLEYVYLARNPGEFTIEFLRRKEDTECIKEKKTERCALDEDASEAKKV